ncbi:MAG: hypothetical protein PVF32_19875, partial [Desulfobacterales bacterium]
KSDKLDDWAPQGFFGLTYQLTDRMLFGVVYVSHGSRHRSGGRCKALIPGRTIQPHGRYKD